MSTTAKSVNWTINKAGGGLSLSANNINFNEVSISSTVTVTRAGDGTIFATSSNSDIVEVTNINQTTGVITLTSAGEGKATVTVSVNEGSNYEAPSNNEVINVSAYFSLNKYTWAEIAQIIKSGKAAQKFKVGDYKDITFPTQIDLAYQQNIPANSTWRVYIIGINHNASKEGNNRVHFCIGRDTDDKEICFNSYGMNPESSNTGGWNGSAMKTWLNDAFYNALPIDLRNVITECTKYTDNVGRWSTTADAVTSTSQKIWLLAEFEVFGARSMANNYEQNSQAQYDYYKNGNSKIRYGHNNGSVNTWYLRSPKDNHAQIFCAVTKDGAAGHGGDAYHTFGVVPCFTIS